MSVSDETMLVRDDCPACGSTVSASVYTCRYADEPLNSWIRPYYHLDDVGFAPLTTATYDLRACSTCGLIFQAEVPTGRLAAVLYDDWLDPDHHLGLERDYATAQRFCRYADVLCSIVNHLGSRPADTAVLDVGMGYGSFCMAGTALGCSTHGIELSEQRVAYARSRGVTVRSYDDLQADEFDIIVLDQVLEHLPEPLVTLQRLKTALRRGGVLFVGVPHARGMRRRLRTMDWDASRDSRRSLMAVYPLEHVNCFAGQSLDTLVARADLAPHALRVRDIASSAERCVPPQIVRAALRPFLWRYGKPNTTRFFVKPA